LPVLGTAVIAVIAGVILLVILSRTIRRQTMAVAAMVAIFAAACWLLSRTSDQIHTMGRWHIQSRTYMAKILAQPNSDDGSLKHLEWDVWGFPGAGDTTEYLVFDPNDSLAIAAKSHSPGRYSGIPCEVPSVRRLEKNWYTVLFYTDTNWNHCG
jgi:hypothetical protein